MRKTFITITFLAATALSGCMANDDLNRAAIGGLAGAGIASITGGNTGVGLIAGAAAGALCDDAGVCR